jgi:hypothetical protein
MSNAYVQSSLRVIKEDKTHIMGISKQLVVHYYQRDSKSLSSSAILSVLGDWLSWLTDPMLRGLVISGLI